MLLACILVGFVLAYSLRWLWMKPIRLDPKGKTFVVTGAASGFGREVTKILTEHGGFVFAIDINAELLAREWEGKPNVHTIRGDVTDPKSVEAAAQEVRDSGRGVFGLFNNAGIAHPAVSIVDCPEEVMVRTMNVNCFGFYRVVKAFFPLLKAENEKRKAAGEGTCAIVNMTSMAGLVDVPMLGAYCISKHAAESLNTVLRREMRLLGIRVTAIEPSFARTPILAAVQQRLDISENCWAELNDAQNTILDNATLLDPVEIANRVVDALLCDPAPINTIVAFKRDYILGRYLIHILPHKVLDWVLTEGLIRKARQIVTASPQKKED